MKVTNMMNIGLKTIRHAGLLMVLVLAANLAPVWGQEKIPLGVRMGDVSINKIPFLVALDQGLYEKNGLDVTLVPFSASAARVGPARPERSTRRANIADSRNPATA